MVFSYDPGAYRQQLEADGYVHLKGVLTDAFVAHMQAFLDRALSAEGAESDAWKITGKKRQFVFDFPDAAAADAFRQGMADLTGIPRDAFTVSERHLKLYDSAADPYPAPHKDRSASHYSIGLPVRLPEGSTVCVFPDMDPGPNTEERAVFLEMDDPDARRALYDGPQASMLGEEVGDVVVFLGSAIFHERVRGAGTAVLYIKANGAGEDPLGENIYDGAAEPA